VVVILSSLSSTYIRLSQFQSFPQKPLDKMEPNMAELLLRLFTTLFMIFDPFRISTWVLGSNMISDWLKFEKSYSQKKMSHDEMATW